MSAEIRYICSRRVTLTLIVPQSTKGFPRLSGWCWRVIKERSMNFHQQSCIIRPQPNRDRLVAHRQTIPCVLNPKFHLQILHKWKRKVPSKEISDSISARIAVCLPRIKKNNPTLWYKVDNQIMFLDIRIETN